MQVTINIDCSPEEARTFLGLPDLTVVHRVYTERLAQVMTEGLSKADLEAISRQWGQGLEQWQKLMWQAATSAATAASGAVKPKA